MVLAIISPGSNPRQVTKNKTRKLQRFPGFFCVFKGFRVLHHKIKSRITRFYLEPRHQKCKLKCKLNQPCFTMFS